MSDAEISALADGVSKFEGFTKGQTQTLTAEQAADRQTRAQAGMHEAPAHADGHAHAQANLPHTLKHGDKGAEVGAVQQQLRDLGYTDSRGNPIGVDRNFGPTTEAAVKAFQTDHGLTPDGKVGPNTARDLHEQTQSQKDNSLQTAAAPQFNTGSPYMDKLMASVNDPAAFKQAMTDLLISQ